MDMTELRPPLDTPTSPSVAASNGLVLDDVQHRFGARRVVDGVSLTVKSGEIHCLLGPSGCGKTTTLRLAAGLLLVQQGRISLNGRLLADPSLCVPPEQRRIGLMFQDFALFPHLKVMDNVAFGLRHLSRSERQRQALDLLAQVGLQDRADSYPDQLSGGEQQRVALARALAPKPQLMLLDEPFSALDMHLRAQVRDEVVAILRRARTPTLIVTHDPDEALRISDCVHVMRGGRIVQSGPPAALYRHPASPFVASFFGKLNRFKGWVVNGVVNTPLGNLPAPDLADGTAVDVCIRPEALNPCGYAPPGSTMLKVNHVRDLGLSRLLELQLPDGGPPILASIKDKPACACYTGDRIGVTLDLANVFVYPADAAN